MRIHGRLFMMLLLVLFVVGCSTPTAESTEPTMTTEVTDEAPTATEEPAPESTEEEQTMEPTEEATAEPSEDEEATEEADAAVQIDGTIGVEEYTDTATFGDMVVSWRHDGEFLYLAMEGPTEGWIAVGIEPTQAMADADYLFGYVEAGEAKFWDAYGTAPVGAEHPPDEELGGTSDIVEMAGTEENGVTRFEVQIPLDSGDEYDKVLMPGESYSIIVAMGPTDEYNSKHFFVSSGELTLQ